MNALTFIAGFCVAALLIWVLARLARRRGYRIYRIPERQPTRLASPGAIQFAVKRFIEARSDGQRLHFWSAEPRFELRIELKARKRRSDSVTVSVIYGTVSPALYELARQAFQEHGVAFEDRLTPKRRKPSRLQVSFDVDVLTPAAVRMAIVAVFRGVLRCQALGSWEVGAGIGTS